MSRISQIAITILSGHFRRSLLQRRTDWISKVLVWYSERRPSTRLSTAIKNLEYYLRKVTLESGLTFSGISSVSERNTGASWHLMVRGWIFHLDEKISSLKIRFDDTDYVVAIRSLPRIDVAQNFPSEPNAWRSGFWVVIPLCTPGVPYYDAQLEATTTSGRVCVICHRIQVITTAERAAAAD